MTRRAHIIDIDRLVIERPAGLSPAALHAAIERAVAGALFSQRPLAPHVTARVPAIAGQVAAQVTHAAGEGPGPKGAS
jgi:hypothetical protein